jgi:hypothetical protein
MRTRFAVLTAGLCALTALSVPAIAGAAPSQSNGLTIATAPSNILAGQSMLIYGHLQGPNNAGQQIILYHRIAGRPSFTIIQRTRTNANGDYEFVRADGIVITNRRWYVVGPNGTHSNTVSEQVSALVSLSSSQPNTTTGQQVVLSGHVFPAGAHVNQKVMIQEQNGLNGNGWKTITSTYTNGHGDFSLGKAWRTPNDYTLRAVVAANAFNVQSFSDDSLTESVQQSENPLFTVNSSNPIIPEGGSATLSGTLYAHGTSNPAPNTLVTLYGKLAGSGSQVPFQELATTTTNASGGYGFIQSPVYNTVYFVRSTLGSKVKTARLFEGVQDQLSINQSSTTSTVGGTVTISGNVSPNKTGSLILLQEQGTDGFWHIVQYGTVTTGSAYSFTVTLGQAGSTELRVRIPGDPSNIGNATTPVSVSVAGVAPVTSLPARAH